AVATFGSNTTSGSALTCGLTWFGNGITFVSVTDNKGNSSWTQSGTTIDYGGGFNHHAFYYHAHISGGASHPGTLTVSATHSFPTIICSEFSGLATTTPHDVTAQTNGSGTSPASGTTTTRAQNNEVLIGWLTTDATGASTINAGSSFSIPTNGSVSNGANDSV